MTREIKDCPFCDADFGCCFCDYTGKVYVGENEYIKPDTYKHLMSEEFDGDRMIQIGISNKHLELLKS